MLGRDSALSMVPEAVCVIEASHAMTGSQERQLALKQIKQEHFHGKVPCWLVSASKCSGSHPAAVQVDDSGAQPPRTAWFLGGQAVCIETLPEQGAKAGDTES